MPTLLSKAEGHTEHGVNRKTCPDPARSETLCMLGSLSYESSEVSLTPVSAGGTGKAKSRNPVAYVNEKSDTSIRITIQPSLEMSCEAAALARLLHLERIG